MTELLGDAAHFSHVHTHSYEVLGGSDVQIPFESQILAISGQVATSKPITSTVLFGTLLQVTGEGHSCAVGAVSQLGLYVCHVFPG